MALRAAMAATQGKAHTKTKTRQLWNWYAEPIWKLQPTRETHKSTADTVMEHSRDETSHLNGIEFGLVYLR